MVKKQINPIIVSLINTYVEYFYWFKLDMKISITLKFTVALLISLIVQICYSVNPLIITIANAKNNSDIINTGQILWNLHDRENFLSDMENYSIFSELLSMNDETLKISKYLPDSEKLVSDLSSLEKRILQIESFFKDMVNYHKNHEDIGTIAKNRMLKLCVNILEYSFYGPIKLLSDIIMTLFAFGSQNILSFFINKLEDVNII